jgi:hypothetical protein
MQQNDLFYAHLRAKYQAKNCLCAKYRLFSHQKTFIMCIMYIVYYERVQQ